MTTTTAIEDTYQAITITPAGPSPFSQASACVRCAADDCAAELGFSRAHLDEPMVIALLLVKGWWCDPARFNPYTESFDRPTRAWCRDHTALARRLPAESQATANSPSNRSIRSA